MLTKKITDSNLYGKIPPQAVELEEAILGAMLLESDSLIVSMSRVFPEIFYKEKHQEIFIAIRKLYDSNKKIDLLTVVEQLKKNEKLDMVGGAYAVTKLTNSVISTAHIEQHISIVSEMYMKREAIRLSGDLIVNSYDDSTDAFEIINIADAGYQRIQERVLLGASKGISFFSMQVLEQHASTKVSGVLGIKTGLTVIDNLISGLVAPDLLILAARPGMGKTAMALSITYNTSVLGNIPCAWFSFEMDGVQLVRRLASIDSGIDHQRIRNGTTTLQEDKLLGDSIEKISNCKIYIEDTSSANSRSIRTRANLLKKKHNIGYIVVDYLQLMRGLETKGKSREQIVSEISGDLKLLAKELEIPVIALSQLSRAVESRPDKMPQLSDLRESGSIEQDADEVIFLMRPEYYKVANEVIIDGEEYHPSGLVIALVEKNRHGSTKNVALKFKGPTMHFTNYEKNTFVTTKSIFSAPQQFPYDDAPF